MLENWGDQGGLPGSCPVLKAALNTTTWQGKANELMPDHVAWPQAWHNATALRCSCIRLLTCHCAAVAANFNLRQSERLIEAVRRRRDLWQVKGWQPEWHAVLEVLSTCCGKSPWPCYRVMVMQYLGKQHGCCLPKFARVGSEQLGEVHHSMLSK